MLLRWESLLSSTLLVNSEVPALGCQRIALFDHSIEDDIVES